MSQKKVDMHKYEKHHRKEIERKKKAKTIISCLLFALAVGACIGVPLGINYYKNLPKIVGDSTLEAFIKSYIDESHSDVVEAVSSSAKEDEATSDDSEEDAVESMIEEAVSTDDADADESSDDSEEVSNEDAEVSEETSEE